MPSLAEILRELVEAELLRRIAEPSNDDEEQGK